MAPIVVALVAACGGSEASEEETPAWEASTGGTAPREEPDDGVQIEGLMGTLSPDEVDRGLQPRMPRFAGCFADRYGELEFVGGSFEMEFHVATDGSVVWVYPRRSTVGDRATERCLLDVARSTTFPRPRGGEAEFSWSLEFSAPDDVRPPFNWDQERVTELLEEHGDQLLSQCRPAGSAAGFMVTVYVAPGGQVMAVGAAVNQQDAAEAIDCIADAVAAWEMPDPGSYPAKVTFVVGR